METESSKGVQNRLAAIRAQRGVSASELAALVGVSRQTIYAVEAGGYVPNTLIGLRLARALGVSIDELFSLVDEAPRAATRAQKATTLPLSEELQPGQAVQLWKVDGRLFAAVPGLSTGYLPPVDAAVTGAKSVRGSARVIICEPENDLEARILVAGCDPAMGMVARYLQTSGIDVRLVHQNSSQSLSLLKNGYAHVAGSHLREDRSSDSNVAVVNKLFPSKSAALVSFAIWQEGLVTAPGNPKSIKGVIDLARKDVTFLNREAGSGSRALLDRYLKELKIDPRAVNGYKRTSAGHLAAAEEVKLGNADCCVTTEASARYFGLTFIPLESVRYDLVVRKQHLKSAGVECLLNAINELSFRRKLSGIAGYDTSVTGTRVQ